MRKKRDLDQFEQARRSVDTMLRFALFAAFAFLAFICFCVYKLLSFFGAW